MRGSAVSHPCSWSRRLRYSSSIARTGSCDPVNAATAAFWVIDDTFDVAWLWMASHAATKAGGPMVQPQRHPVIEYAFDAEPQMTPRSRHLRATIPGRLCGTRS